MRARVRYRHAYDNRFRCGALGAQDIDIMCTVIDVYTEIIPADMSLSRAGAILRAVTIGEDPVCGGPDAEVINRWCAYLRGET